MMKMKKGMTTEQVGMLVLILAAALIIGIFVYNVIIPRLVQS